MTILSFVTATLLLLTASVFGLWVTRASLYRNLGTLQAAHRKRPADLAGLIPGHVRLPKFDQRLVRMENILPRDVFEPIREEIAGLVDTERSYLLSHKKGGTVAYETLLQKAPRTVQLYLSGELSDLISAIVGEAVGPTPLYDQSSCSVLFYERPGDHIGWHFDHNFYRGRHLTVLIPILNTGHGPDGLSSARLEARIDGVAQFVSTPPNTLIMFEGQKVLHRVTPIDKDERRVILSMTFATDSSANLLQGIKRRIKDTAFFGLRALWT
ncbi:MAG: 2OG-Fe(II) oxygenase [Alphaproteobacteria bacterium]|nr:2OG-Fe(II) oxygenase [Alphaproteobacteria bacterium]